MYELDKNREKKIKNTRKEFRVMYCRISFYKLIISMNKNNY